MRKYVNVYFKTDAMRRWEIHPDGVVIEHEGKKKLEFTSIPYSKVILYTDAMQGYEVVSEYPKHPEA